MKRKSILDPANNGHPARDQPSTPQVIKSGWLPLNPMLLFLFIAVSINAEGFLFVQSSLVRLLDHHDMYFDKAKTMGQLFFKYGPTGWNPSLLGGLPNHASGLHPSFLLNPLAAFLPSWLVAALFNILLTGAVLIGTYLYLRDIVRLDERVAFAGAIFHLSAYLLSNINAFTTWGDLFPLLFVCTYRLAEPVYKKAPNVLVLIVIFSILYTPYTLPFMPAFHLLFVCIHFRGRDLKKHLKIFAFTWLGFAAFHAPEIYSIFALVPVGHRQDFLVRPGTVLRSLVFVIKSSGHIIYPLMFLVPFAFFERDRRKTSVLILAALLTVLILYAIIDSWVLVAILPAIKQFSLVRFAYISGFLFAVLAAIGLQNLKENATVFGLSRSLILSCSLLAAVLLASFIGQAQWALQVLVAVFIALFAVASLREAKGKPIFLFLLLLVLVTSKLDFHFRDKHASYRSVFDVPAPPNPPNSPFRTVSVLEAGNIHAIFPAQMSIQGVETLDGMQILYYRRFRRFWESTLGAAELRAVSKAVDFKAWGSRVNAISINGRLESNLNLLAMANTYFIYSSVPLERAEGLQLVYKRVGVPKKEYKRLIIGSLRSLDVGKTLKMSDGLLAQWRQRPTVYIYRLKTAFPRAWLSSKWVVKDTDKDTLLGLKQATASQLRRTAFLSQVPVGVSAPVSDHRHSNNDSVRILKYSPDMIELETRARQPSVLVVSNSFDERWEATIDGSAAPLLRANYAFQGIFVPKGEHSIALRFRDPVLWWLYLLMPLSALLLFMPALIGSRLESTIE